MLSMPRGADPLAVQRAAREFAQMELRDHRFVMVLHDHQANPHVHISVRVESRHGSRLNPRKADLQRWRETFAEKLRGWGIEAEATRQATRGQNRNFEPLWRVKAAQEGRLFTAHAKLKSGPRFEPKVDGKPSSPGLTSPAGLADSEDPEDRALAKKVDRYVCSTPFALEYKHRLDKRPEPVRVTSGRESARGAEQPARPLARGSEIQR